MWMASVDTGGHTVDMALVYKTLTAEAVAQTLQGEKPRELPFAGRIILPGLAADIAAPTSKTLGHPVEVGPICAAELPLFFASDWVS
jgi:CO dehydrogenase/acetyl-CoA synthase gamma subunit (corrinoid Fe-S protein)